MTSRLAETLQWILNLKKIIFMSSDKKKWNKAEKYRTNMEKENNTNESDITDLNSLEPFEFEPKRNIGDISNSQKQLSEVFCNKRYS